MSAGPKVSRRRYDAYIDQWSRQKQRLNAFPTKLTPRLVALHYISRGFDHDREYSEDEVNQKIAERNLFGLDHVHLRRYLIDHLMLERTRDGAVYKVSRGYLSLAQWDSEIPGGTARE